MSYPDYRRARAVFDEAAAFAHSAVPVPEEWVARANRVAASRSKTYTAALGTALLARATEGRVDVMTLQVRAPSARGYRSYTARSLAQHVLAPKAAEHRIDIRTTGREPLNNQPFFAEPLIHRGINAKDPHDWNAFVDAIEAIHPLSRAQARLALVAFLRARIAAAPHAAPELWPPAPSLANLIDGTVRFVTAESEGGRRGQAMVAASLDVSFGDVSTSRVNDPSRRWPGDVFRGPPDRPDLSVEVKQRPADDDEVLRFAGRAAAAGVRRAAVALLDPSQPALDTQGLKARALAENDIAVEVYLSARDWLLASAVWAGSLDEFAAAFREAMRKRLVELEAAPRSVNQWVEMWKEDDPQLWR